MLRDRTSVCVCVCVQSAGDGGGGFLALRLSVNAPFRRFDSRVTQQRQRRLAGGERGPLKEQTA